MALSAFGEALWLADGPQVRWLGFPFPTRMVVARLPDGGLFVHSPIALTEEVRASVERLGTPRSLVSPNKLHHLFLGEWQRAYPEARCLAPPGLKAKRPDLRFDGELGAAPEPGWAGELELLRFEGSRLLEEVVFLHRRSKTVILGDLVENLELARLTALQRLVARGARIAGPRGETPLDFRLLFLGRHTAARRARERLLAFAPERVVMCHGVPVEDGALPFLEHAFGWLGPAERGAE